MKVKVYIQTNKVGSKCEDELEIPDEDLAGLSPEQVEAEIDKQAREIAFNMMEWGWKKS